ncbi:glycosyltransferase family 2 protein [Corynebacterium sp.]|uniref:glycosyltransferase family 2 protein n=1 Tax=Corynebacterium sp. TaxID=1720 RepID=UPI0026DEC93D|nr:glycosyltransferase family 2 protein [Corynebacterium sp.]MDO5511230.1 glycosyltransferase family 2 protein [Corynebacterium sp.]
MTTPDTTAPSTDVSTIDPDNHFLTYAPQRAAEVEVYRAPSIVACIIPAYNEESTIAAVLESVLAQSRLPDVVHVVVNNTTDDTYWIAREYCGRHDIDYRGVQQSTEIFIHDVGRMADRKVGALNYGFDLLGEDVDYVIGVDGDTTPHPKAFERLLAEAESDSRIGGVSAIYSIDTHGHRGPIANFLVVGQRAQFASFTLLNLCRGRNMAVLGGQCSIFSARALRHVKQSYNQKTPWVNDSEVEDSLLSLQIRSAGYLTKISSTARADVGGMTTLRALDAQQVKWNYGAIDLMWPGERGNLRGQPFHPNLRLRWYENIEMLLNFVVRVGFVLLLLASLSIGAFSFQWWWLIPPVLATLLNLRVALTMENRTTKDILFALLFFPAEIYMWIKIGHFLRAWTRFLSRVNTDNWGDQAKAEQGKGGWKYLGPLLALVIVVIIAVGMWLSMPTNAQVIALWIGWPIQAAVTLILCLIMVRRLTRRQYGYRV